MYSLLKEIKQANRGSERANNGVSGTINHSENSVSDLKPHYLGFLDPLIGMARAPANRAPLALTIIASEEC